jgi:hypothetical protein
MKLSFANVALLGLLTVLSCGGLADASGSSAHFLEPCAGVDCGSGLSCICGTCTRTCSGVSDCTDLASDAVCAATDAAICGTSAGAGLSACAVVPCSTHADCAAVGPFLICMDGVCQQGSPPGPESTGGSLGWGGSPSTGGWTTGGTAGGWTTGGTGGIAVKPLACLSGETKGGACSFEGYSCYKTCGPKSVGWKTETCIGGVFTEGSCNFDSWNDYTCFVIPPVIQACTPTGPATASQPCYVPDCMPCGPDYFDSAGNAKVGYCVCNGGDGVGTVGTWSCASPTAWPPQP